jgi:hypothetical protein
MEIIERTKNGEPNKPMNFRHFMLIVENIKNVDVPDVTDILGVPTYEHERDQPFYSKLEKIPFEQEIHDNILKAVLEAVNLKEEDFPILIGIYYKTFSSYILFFSVGKSNEKNISVRKNKFFQTIDKYIDKEKFKTTLRKGSLYNIFENYLYFAVQDCISVKTNVIEKKQL